MSCSGRRSGLPSGIVVDTHVHRLSRLLGLTTADTPEEIEKDLMELFPQKQWIDAGMLLILHGRKHARRGLPIVRPAGSTACVLLRSFLSARHAAEILAECDDALPAEVQKPMISHLPRHEAVEG